MPAIDRPHKWKWRGLGGGACERCGRTYVMNESLPTNCLSEGELAERAEWQTHAEIAANLMKRRAPK